MMTDRDAVADRWRHLVDEYMQGTCTREELDEFLERIRCGPGQEGLADEFRRYWRAAEGAPVPTDAAWDKRYKDMMHSIDQLYSERTKSRRRSGYLGLAAAMIMLGLMVGGWWWHRDRSSAVPEHAAAVARPLRTIQPGGNHAVLVLASGASVILDSSHTGSLPRQGASSIRRLGSGQILYTVVASPAPKPVYNTLKVPKAGQYRIVLPDGTHVWLNAASSLTYPTAFTGNLREVRLSGEAYFEVSQDPDRPFVVKVGSFTAKVLGTRFNIMAYPDEPSTHITLLGGSLKVRSALEDLLLHPGQQARMKPSSGSIRIHPCDTAEVVAWKDGLFRFSNTPLESIMRQIARWYDVEVSYQGDIADRAFTGTLSRNVSLDHVLQVLALSKVHFKVKDSVITVFQ